MSRLRKTPPDDHLKRAWAYACAAADFDALADLRVTAAAAQRLSGNVMDALRMENAATLCERRAAECDGMCRGHFFRYRELVESTAEVCRG